MKNLFVILFFLVATLVQAAPPILRNSLTTNTVPSLTTNLTSAKSGGDARGVGATDLQVDRASADQVAAGNYSTLAGGRENRAGGLASVVGGGAGNSAGGSYSAVLGGVNNQLSGNYQFIGGGFSNVIDSAPNALICGGLWNAIANDADDSSLVGGLQNSIGPWAHIFLGGGRENYANNDGVVLGGGRFNTNSAEAGFIGGGYYNHASGGYAVTIPGGVGNTVSADFSSAVGSSNIVSGSRSVAVGHGLNVSSNSTALIGAGTNFLSVGPVFSNTVPFQIETDAVVSPFDFFTNSVTRAFYMFTLQITGDGDIPPNVLFTLKVTNLGTTNLAGQWGVDSALFNYYNTLVVPVGPSERVWVESSDGAGTVLRVLRFQ